MGSGGQLSVLIELLPFLLGIGVALAIPMLVGVFVTPARLSPAVCGLAVGVLISGFSPRLIVDSMWKSGNDVGAAMIGELANLAYPFSILLGLFALALRLRRTNQYP
jgi:ribose/xylose/arabinose/galactoside ABC-type transport system permease subunit